MENKRLTRKGLGTDKLNSIIGRDDCGGPMEGQGQVTVTDIEGKVSQIPGTHGTDGVGIGNVGGEMDERQGLGSGVGLESGPEGENEVGIDNTLGIGCLGVEGRINGDENTGVGVVGNTTGGKPGLEGTIGKGERLGEVGETGNFREGGYGDGTGDEG